MNFAVLPPEVNSARLYLGAGSRPMLVAAVAWDGLATELALAAASFGSVTTGLGGGSWQGPASMAMTAAIAPYLGWLNTAAAEAERVAAQARVVAAAFEAAQAATVYPGIVAANRARLVSLVISNLFGQNAAAIAATEAAYEQMWAQDVTAMAGYHAGASAAVSALTPFTQPLANLARPDASAAAAAATAQAAVTSSLSDATSSLGYANVGGGNLGSGNAGVVNVGVGNLGSYNVGAGNLGDDNFGFGNAG
ncbi:PPE family protein, partial [Mycobacterium lacus]